MANLENKRVAFLATDGVEQVELTEPWKAIKEAGGRPVLVSLKSGSIQAFNHLSPGDTFSVDETVADTAVDKFDALVLPGGVVNPDFLRADRGAVSFVRSFFEQNKPVGAICHGLWMLVEADVLRGRSVTSWPSIKTDVANAGGHWSDEEVIVDERLVTSRKPDDLPAFCSKLVEEVAEGTHEEQSRSLDGGHSRAAL